MAMVAGALRARCPEARFDLRWYGELPSTMDVAATALTAGVVVVAATQTEGRGRRGRQWTSPPGAGLYLSMVLPAPSQAALTPLVTLAAGVGVIDALRQAGLRAALKWPNDVMMGPHKLAGILAEGYGLGTADAAIVMGIGINLRPAAYPPEVAARATSVERELGRPVEAGALLTAVVAAVWDRTHALDADPGGILQAWREAAPSAVGTPVEWDAGNRVVAGVSAGIDDTGALLVRTGGRTERIAAGEVRWML